MFEFGKDLRRLFERARDSDDLAWLELISTILVENEARHQSIESGRVSCPNPHEACLRASQIWREHARRTGNPQSLSRAEAEARAASRHAVNDEQTIRAFLELAQSSLLAFDLSGGLERLRTADKLLATLPTPRRALLVETIAAIEARICARRAVLSGAPETIRIACDGLETVVQSLRSQHRLVDIERRIEQAALSLEIGLITRDLQRLEKAGQDLRSLIENAPSDQKPITRARALALCGVGMRALSSIANDEVARQQADSLMDAAVDQFTMDHSPLDWAAIQLMRPDSDGSLPLITLLQVEALTAHEGLIIGAEARERRLAQEIHDSEQAQDLFGLRHLEAHLLSRLRDIDTPMLPLDWAWSQMGLARIALARSRLTGQSMGNVGMMLLEAADTARELGAVGLSNRARDLLPHPLTV
jgi:hypothetical protein